MTLDRTTPPHIITLVLAAAVAALAMNVFLPSLPGMAREFESDYQVAQLAVSLYLAATAILQLFIGPASDRYGRRPVLLFCMAIFCVSTIACMVAPTIELLLTFRVIQAAGAAGIVLSRAVVRDMVGADEAASRIGYVTMGMAIAPMIGPAIGGVMDELYGWRSTFALTLGLGVIAFAAIYFDLGETNHNRSSSMSAQMRGYPELARSRRFWGYAVTAAFTSGTFFAFLGGAPFVATAILGMRPSEYGLWFAIVSAGYVVGNFVSGRYASRYGVNTMMISGNVVSIIGVASGTILFATGYVYPASLFVPVALVGIGNGMTLPSALSGLVSVRPHLAGSASGLGGMLQIGGGALLSVVAAALLTQESGGLPLLLVMLASSVSALIASLYVLRIARLAGD